MSSNPGGGSGATRPIDEGYRGYSVAGADPCLPRPELELALADHGFVLEVDQEGAALADHAVEGEQVPDVDAPANVAALARRRPLGRLQVAQAGRSDLGLRAQLAE